MRVGRDSIKGVGGKGGGKGLFILPNFSGFRNWDSLKWGELDNGLLNGCNVRGSAVGFCTGGDNKWFTDPAFRFCDVSQIV